MLVNEGAERERLLYSVNPLRNPLRLCSLHLLRRNLDRLASHADLVEQVARRSDLPRKDAEEVVQLVLDSLVDSLNAGEKVELTGLGSFRFREKGPRQGRNPKTGEQVNVPAKKVVYFKPGKLLKELINS